MFYYTNFLLETNGWWIRRVRPLWMGALAIYCYWLFNRYYFFGKHAVNARDNFTPEQLHEFAALNKRNFGWGHYYKPTYHRSIKKQVMEAMGKDYDYAVATEERIGAISTMEELQEQIDSENAY